MDGPGDRAWSARHSWRIAAVASAVVVALGMGTAAVAALVGGSGEPPQEVAAAAPPEDLPGGISGDDPCVGPPPFAGVEPESEEARSEEADEFSSQREQCPTNEDTDDGTAEGPVTDPFPDDPCKGPPPFAGTVPDSGEQRAEEAAEFSAEREQCPTDDNGTDNNGSDENGTEGQNGDQAGESGDPPGSNSAGPSENTPTGPPASVRTGPPEGTPTGPPEGTPAGPPEGTPTGPPEGTPTGPPEGTPAGPPEGTPAGPPEGTPTGPPAGIPGPGV